MAYYEYRPIGIAFIVIALLYGFINHILWFPLSIYSWINPIILIILFQISIGIILMFVEVDSAEKFDFMKGLYYVGMILTFLEILSFIYPRSFSIALLNIN